MGNGSVVNSLIEQALLNTHTGFFGKVMSVKGFTAKVQPLQQYKAVGGTAKKHAVLLSVPILHNVRKWREREITFTDEDTTDGDTNMSSVVAAPPDKSHKHKFTVYDPIPIEKGDIVYCVCADREITQTKKGKFALPTLGHHNLTDAVIIGVIDDEEWISKKKKKQTLKKEK